MPCAATWKDLEIIILSEIRQRQIYISLTWVILINGKMNLFTNQKQTHRHRKYSFFFSSLHFRATFAAYGQVEVSSLGVKSEL